MSVKEETIVNSSAVSELTSTASHTQEPQGQDPQEWPTWRKHAVLFVLAFGGAAGLASVSADQLAFAKQTDYYNLPPISLSYAISAGIAGIIVGPFLLVPFTPAIGRSTIVFWSLVGVLACNIWGALMTGPHDYKPFVVSRALSGVFGQMPITLASGYIMDLYQLEQRGRAFTIAEISYLIGTLGSPALGGFIAYTRPWMDIYWWLVAMNGFVVIVALFVLKEPKITRGVRRSLPAVEPSYWSQRIAILTGRCSTEVSNRKIVAQRFVNPFLISLSPITILIGLFVAVTVGSLIAVGVLSTVFLQTPVKAGGYGFNALQNATWNIYSWLAIGAAELIGHLLADRVPLMISRRTGAWHPEYRLANIAVVFFITPIGLGIFGAGLKYHLSYVVLALGAFLAVIGGVLSTPISVNYITEAFPELNLEVSVSMSMYRQILGLTIPFFADAWIARTGPGWLYGILAILSLVMSGLVLILLLKGQELRKYSLVKCETEDTDHVEGGKGPAVQVAAAADDAEKQ